MVFSISPLAGRPSSPKLQQSAARPLWIVAPDCRGHGDSGWVGDGGYYHFPDYVLDLDSVIQALGVQSIKLIGHSMGGTISLLYTGAFPERVIKLALIEGVGPVGMNFADAPLRMAQLDRRDPQARPQSLSRSTPASRPAPTNYARPILDCRKLLPQHSRRPP